jgi:hypothetical protein
MKGLLRFTACLLAFAAMTSVSLRGLSPLMNSGTFLYPGDSVSAEGCTLTYQQSDGNLVLYCGGSPTWWSGTNGTTPGYVTMQTDGNFVIYHGSGTWSTNTWGHNGANLWVGGNNVTVISARNMTNLWVGFGPTDWYSDACVQHYEDGYLAYQIGRVDIMCTEWMQIVQHAGASDYCQYLRNYAGVNSVVQTCSGSQNGCCYQCDSHNQCTEYCNPTNCSW